MPRMSSIAAALPSPKRARFLGRTLQIWGLDLLPVVWTIATNSKENGVPDRFPNGGYEMIPSESSAAARSEAEITWACAIRTSWSILWRSVFLWVVLLMAIFAAYRISPAYNAPDVLLRFPQSSSVEGSFALPFETLERILIALGLLIPIGFVAAVRNALQKSGFSAPVRSHMSGHASRSADTI